MRNCTKRKREFRIHEILPNGQHFNLYFKKHGSKEGDNRIHGIWTVGLHIGSSRKEANLWYDSAGKSKDSRQTGTCGLEALFKAAKYITEFVSILGFHSELQIGWQDDKRRRAYRWLLRYDFKEYDDCYAVRNPEYWEMKAGD